MADDIIRFGKISSVNRKKGTVRVAYSDRSDKVTPDIPCLSMGEDNLPEVGEQVAVIHPPAGSGRDICLGTMSSGKSSSVSEKGGYYKKLGTASMKVEGGSLSFADDSGSVSIAEILEMKKEIAELKSRLGG